MADAQVNRGRRGDGRKAAAALASIALAVAAAGAFLLPSLRTGVPRRPLLPPAGVIPVTRPLPDGPCYPKRFRYRFTRTWSACWFHELTKSPWPEN